MINPSPVTTFCKTEHYYVASEEEFYLLARGNLVKLEDPSNAKFTVCSNNLLSLFFLFDRLEIEIV